MKNYVLQGTISASVLSFNSNLINHYANHTGLKAELPISDGGSNWGTASVHGPLCKRKKGLKSTKFTWAEVVLDLIPEMASSN